MTDGGGARRVFVSHASADADVALRFVAALELHGIRCWIAPRDVVAGAQYADAIVRAIAESPVFLVLLSAHAIASAHVGREVERAGSKRRRILALRLDSAPLTPALEYFLSESQWVDLQAGEESAQARLFQAIEQAPGLANVAAVPISAALKKDSKRVQITLGACAALAIFGALAWKFLLPKAVPVPTPAPTTVAEKSIAVLPFADMSEKKDQEFFADGMAEEVIDLLAKAPKLHVIARTSSFYFKGRPAKIRDIGRELGVTHLLEGSIRRSGNKIRVTATLVRADTDEQLWSETYDRDLRDIFAIQDEIANAVAQALQIGLMGGPLTRVAGGTENLEAYQLYLRSRALDYENSEASLGEAGRYLDQAVKLDANFGLAWTELASNTIIKTDNGVLPPREGYERARTLARRATEASPNLAEPHALLQYLYRAYDWDWRESEAEGQQALRMEPTNTHALMFSGMLAATLGHWDEAERYGRSSIARDPLDTFVIFNYGNSLYRIGRFSDAESEFRKLLRLAPTFTWTRAYLAKTLVAEGKAGEALGILRQEQNELNQLLFMPIVLQAAGRKIESDNALNEMVTKYAAGDAYFAAIAYAYRNDRDSALLWLDRAYTQKDVNLAEIIGEPLFANIAGDDRFMALLRKLNLPVERTP